MMVGRLLVAVAVLALVTAGVIACWVWLAAHLIVRKVRR